MPSNSDQNQPKANPSKTLQGKDYDALVRLVSERVWALWQEDLRRNRERNSKTLRR